MWLMRRRGGEPPREISTGQGRQPDWSPDGRWIAFTSTRGDPAGRQAVFVVAPNGGEPVQLTDYALDARHPVWSPDSRRLVFSALLPGGKQAYGLATLRVPALHGRRRVLRANSACTGAASRVLPVGLVAPARRPGDADVRLLEE
jgi:dipeptidyl aminopeptidase/acylaminoacyl peptidase